MVFCAESSVPNLYSQLKILVHLGEPKREKEPLTAARALRNYQLSQYRVIVENAIMRLKRWAVVGSKFRHWHLVEDPDAEAPDLSFLERTVRVLCALTNWQVHIKDLRPLRGVGWSPKPSDSYMAKLNTRAENERAAGKQEDYVYLARFRRGLVCGG